MSCREAGRDYSNVNGLNLDIEYKEDIVTIMEVQGICLEEVRGMEEEEMV